MYVTGCTTRRLYVHVSQQQCSPRLSGACGSVELLFDRMMNWMRVPQDAELHVNFVSISEMSRIHWETKMKKGPTDVLSIAGSGSGKLEEKLVNQMIFAKPSLFINGNGDAERSTSDSNDLSVLLRETRIELTDLGDIFVCPEYVLKTCQRFPRKCLPADKYFVSAYIHAFLHVLGYDHDTHDNFTEMARVERHLGSRVLRHMASGELPPLRDFYISLNTS